MAEESKKQDQLVEATDYLEAVGTLKNNKNLFFFLCFICLLILQGIFWLTPTEFVDMSDGKSADSNLPANAVVVQSAAHIEKEIKIEKKGQQIEKAAQEAVADGNQAHPAEPNENILVKIIPVREKIKFSQLSWIVKLCNFLLIFCAVIYSLSLLFCMKVSLVGRLGGIRHITKAVFISFFMVALILPWQIPFKGVIAGVVYTAAELSAAWTNYGQASFVSHTVMFLRFTGLWVVAVILLFWSQIRSMRWSKNTLKRLGIMV